MSSVNGIGTGWRGWRHGEHDVSTATLWFTFVYLPIVPLRRSLVRNLTDFEAERIRTLPQAVGAAALLASPVVTYEEHVEVLERTPLEWREVVATYLRAYVLLPLLILWPIVLGRLVLEWVPDRNAIPAPLAVGVIAFGLLNMIVVLLIAVRRMRRGRSQVPARPC